MQNTAIGNPIASIHCWFANKIAFRMPWTNNFRYRRANVLFQCFVCTKFATSGILSRSIRFRCLIAAHEKPINYSSAYIQWQTTNLHFIPYFNSFHIGIFVFVFLFFVRPNCTKYVVYSLRMYLSRERKHKWKINKLKANCLIFAWIGMVDCHLLFSLYACQWQNIC